MLNHYIAVAVRNIRGVPVASVINLLTLALGLVCFVTAHAFFVFWESSEQHFPKSLDTYVLTLSMKNRQNGFGFENSTTVPDVAAEYLRSDYPAIAKVARAVIIDRKTMVASGGTTARVFGVGVDAEFLDIFDLPFVAGDARTALASPRSAVITRDYADRLFGTAQAVGESILIGNSVNATITGVVDAIPEPSHLGRSTNALLPFDLLTSRDVVEDLRGGVPPNFAWVISNSLIYLYLPSSGGLRAGALEQQLQDFAARHVPEEFLGIQDYRFGLAPVGALLASTQGLVGKGPSLTAVLLLLAGLVLGVACVNYSNLSIAQAARHVRAIGVRKAIGATPAHIAAQSFAEAAVAALAALIVALAVFIAAQPIVKRVLGTEIDANFFADLAVWPALAGLVAAVTLAAGAYPAFVLSRVDTVRAMTVAQTRLGSQMFSTLVVSAQFAVASFLLITLAVISLQNADMRRNALSAIEDPLVLIENPTSQTGVSPSTLRERLGRLSQVRGITELRFAPWESYQLISVERSPDPTSGQHGAVLRQVGFDFFEVFDVGVLAGRVFDRAHEDLPRLPQEAPEGSELPETIVVDAAFARSLGFAAPEDAVEQLVYRPGQPPFQAPLPPLRIIGVVEDRVFGFFKTPGNAVGTAYEFVGNLQITVARVSVADLEHGLLAIDTTWRDLAPNVAVSRRFLDEVFEQVHSRYERINQVCAALALMAFAISVAGLFGMATLVADRRRREMGLRKTLGASTPRIVALLLRSFATPVVLGNLIALPAGYFAARTYLNQFAVSIELTPWLFVLSVAITLAIACVAVAGQTVRAALTAPAGVLRQT